MELKKSALYAFIYGWREYPPNRTNLCKLFWSFWLAVLWGWPVVTTLAFLFFATIPTKEGRKPWEFWGRLRLDRLINPPFVGPAPVLFLTWTIITVIASTVYVPLHFLGIIKATLTLMLAIGSGCWLVIISITISGIHNWRQKRAITSPAKEPDLFFLWLKAKKEKVCPFVIFVK